MGEFSITVKRVLTCLAENDPTQLNCMEANFIDKAGWCFSFDTETCFVTTFGDIYPKSHSRHCHLKNKMYEYNQKKVFIKKNSQKIMVQILKSKTFEIKFEIILQKNYVHTMFHLQSHILWHIILLNH